MGTGRSDETVMNFINYQFINYSLHDILERREESDPSFVGMASHKTAQEHVPRKAKKSSGEANTGLTTVSKTSSANESFVSTSPSIFTNANRREPMYIQTADIVWMGENNVDDELEGSIPQDEAEELNPSQSSSPKRKSRKELTDENTAMIESSPTTSKPSKTKTKPLKTKTKLSKPKVQNSSEDLSQDSYFVNIFHAHRQCSAYVKRHSSKRLKMGRRRRF